MHLLKFGVPNLSAFNEVINAFKANNCPELVKPDLPGKE